MKIVTYIENALREHINGTKNVAPAELLATIEKWREDLELSVVVASEREMLTVANSEALLYEWLTEPKRSTKWLWFTAAEASSGFPELLRGREGKVQREAMLDAMTKSGKLVIQGKHFQLVMP